MKQLVEAVCAMTGRHRLVLGLPDRLSYLQAWLLEHLPGKLMTRDNYCSMQVDEHQRTRRFRSTSSRRRSRPSRPPTSRPRDRASAIPSFAGAPGANVAA